MRVGLKYVLDSDYLHCGSTDQILSNELDACQCRSGCSDCFVDS